MLALSLLEQHNRNPLRGFGSTLDMAYGVTEGIRSLTKLGSAKTAP